jgi:hypothetical protein
MLRRLLVGTSPLHTRSLRQGLGSKTSWREDRLSWRQERQEAGGGGHSEQASGALASVVGNRGGLRSAA